MNIGTVLFSVLVFNSCFSATAASFIFTRHSLSRADNVSHKDSTACLLKTNQKWKGRHSLLGLPDVSSSPVQSVLQKAAAASPEVHHHRQQQRADVKKRLENLLSQTPGNAPTPRDLTEQILTVVRELEQSCPTPDSNVLSELAGNWELTWTAQDKSSPEWKLGALRTWINPLENQAYSNNPYGAVDSGRANPVLPRGIQDRLESLGVIQSSGESSSSSSSDPVVRSSQSIDRKKSRVRNVVTLNLPGGSARASLTVDVRFQPDSDDPRRVNVKFDSCRVVVPKTPIDWTFPLGIIGPTGWLRTGYLDDSIRITRGHKGSVFILSRTSAATRKGNMAK